MKENKLHRCVMTSFSRRQAIKSLAIGLASGASFSSLSAPRSLLGSIGAQTPSRYPDPNIVKLDDRFTYGLGNAAIERLYTGMRWAEGPAWNGVGRYLVFSDIPNNQQLRYLEEDGHITQGFRSPSHYSNGNTFDFKGRQISCQHSTRRVVRYEHNGSMSILADGFNGKAFNAPNDVVVNPHDDSIWFTDPGYGSLSLYEGAQSRPTSVQPNQKEAVYRIDATSGRITQVTDDIYKPNGLCFSPDYSKLYVSDTGASHYAEAKACIRVWDVRGGQLSNGREFCAMEYNGQSGFADGIKADVFGNIWASAGWVGEGYDGVHIFAPTGDRIGMILLPEICSNLCFGGARGDRLFMTASQSLYSVYVGTQGALFI